MIFIRCEDGDMQPSNGRHSGGDKRRHSVSGYLQQRHLAGQVSTMTMYCVWVPEAELPGTYGDDHDVIVFGI